MLQFIRKASALIITGTVSMVLAACYGTPMDIEGYKWVQVTNEDNEPIEGLELKLMKDSTLETVKTNADGVSEFYGVYESETEDYSIEITDIDGEENGGLFENKTVDITQATDYSVKLKKQ